MKRLFAAVVFGILVTTSAGTAASAKAPAPQPTPEPTPILVESHVADMVYVGFDPAVARANGYAVAYGTDGNPYSIQTQGNVQPYNMVNGNCGSSWVYLYDIGEKKYRVTTGWASPYSAVYYTWNAPVGGVNHFFSGSLAFRTSWQGSRTGYVPIPGWYLASAAGVVTFSNGHICASDGPLDTEAIF